MCWRECGGKKKIAVSDEKRKRIEEKNDIEGKGSKRRDEIERRQWEDCM